MSISHRFTPVVARQQQGKTNVFGGSQIRQQMVKLKNNTNLAVAVARQFSAAGAFDCKLTERDAAMIGRFDAGDKMQQSRLASAGRSHDCNRFTRRAEKETPRKTSMRSPLGDKKDLRRSADRKSKVQCPKSNVRCATDRLPLIRVVFVPLSQRRLNGSSFRHRTLDFGLWTLD